MRSGDVVADRFAIGEMVGSGGMGVVHRAVDRLTGETVAVKILREHDDVTLARFFLEARILAELRHPGIVRYIAHGTTIAGDTWLAMEWLVGESLADKLRAGPLPVKDVLSLGARAAEALGVAHAAGVVHRDVKPSNIFLVHGGVDRVKILDFGVARRGPFAGPFTPAGSRVGTPRYMAPEQVRGEDIDGRVDVFALGCVLYLCLTGRNAFLGKDEMAVLAKILLDDPPAAHRVRLETPPALGKLISRMLAKDASTRPGDGAQVAAALLDIPADEMPTPQVEPLPAEAERRLLTVVLVSPQKARADRDNLVALARAAAAQHGATLAVAERGYVAVLSGAKSATDQAAQAARLAIALRGMFPDGPIAVATGLGVYAQTMPAGDVIDRAALLLQGAYGTVAVLDEATAGLVDERFEVRITAAGRVLLGERDKAPGARTLLGRPTPHVGRERELALLEAVFAECVAESVARVVLVTAPPGAGKSRLRYEFTRRHPDVPFFLGRGDPMRAGAPFGLIAPMIRREASVFPSDPAEAQRQNLLARVAERVPRGEAARVARFLGELAGIPFADDDVQLAAARRDPELMGDQMRRAWEDFLTAECRDRPLLVVVDDLHWGDLPSVMLIDSALRALSSRSFLVLALARPDVHLMFPSLWEDRGATEVRLAPLPRRAGERLVRAVLGEGVGGATMDRLLDLAGGNPFYLEELIRAVAEGKKDKLPETVLAMVQSRIEGFGADARRVVRAAAIFGEVFWASGIRAILGDDAEIDEWLPVLSQREVVIPKHDSKFADEKEYAFRHALMREAAYALWSDAERARAHRAAGEWLERQGEDNALLLAEHFRRGGAPKRAVAWYCRAAEQALDGNDFRATVERAQLGLDCGPEGALRASLLLLQAEARTYLGENEAAIASCREVMTRGRPGEDAWCAAAGELITVAGRQGDGATCRAVAGALLDMPPEPTAARVTALARAVGILILFGMDEAAAPFERRMALDAESLARFGPLAEAHVHSARALRALAGGDLVGYRDVCRASVEALERAGAARRAAEARSNLGFALVELGRYEDAERELRVALVEKERLRLASAASALLANLGWAVVRAGRIAEGTPFVRRALDLARAQSNSYDEGVTHIYLARLLTEAGRPTEAEIEARAAADIFPETSPLGCYARGALADALRAAGRTTDALRAADEARRYLAGARDLHEGDALVRMAVADALAAAGRTHDAAAARADARARLQARADRIADPALRASFLRVPENARTLEGL
ncbi:MAG TPA: protein kinase [Haliangiales bacterium]|nr:protein kinase [Haliangiales bacterium]